jgi:hypothetical protein
VAHLHKTYHSNFYRSGVVAPCTSSTNPERDNLETTGYQESGNIPQVTDSTYIPQHLCPRRHINACTRTPQRRRPPNPSLPCNRPPSHSDDTYSHDTAKIFDEGSLPNPILLNQLRKRIIRQLRLLRASHSTVRWSRAPPPLTTITIKQRIAVSPSKQWRRWLGCSGR